MPSIRRLRRAGSAVRFSMSSPPEITISRLLKSCATPPVKLPDRLDLLGLAQRFLHPCALGDLRAQLACSRSPIRASAWLTSSSRSVRHAPGRLDGSRTSYCRCRARTAAFIVLVSVIGLHRPLQQRHVAQRRHQPLAHPPTLTAVPAARQHDERQVGPGGLTFDQATRAALSGRAAPPRRRRPRGVLAQGCADQGSEIGADLGTQRRPGGAARPRRSHPARWGRGSGPRSGWFRRR